jgi:hypothetical protein
VEGYVACERSAENYGWADAVAWGYGEYFPPDFQKEVEDSLNDFESALYDLEASLEIHDAFALVAIGLQIMWLESPQVAHLLKPIVGDRSYLNGWKELEQILWSHPEFLSGFDRFCLGSSWSVTRYGESVSLPLDNPEEAASGLYMLMQDSAIYSRRAPAACRKLLEDPDDKSQRYLACLEGYSGACRFVGLLQNLLIKFSSYPVALDFWHAELGDLAIIKASLKWNLGNDDSVEWSLYWYASGSELASPRGNNILMGLWYFVNSFQSRCGIYPKHGSELWRDLVWQLGRDSTAVDLSKYKLVGNSS